MGKLVQAEALRAGRICCCCRCFVPSFLDDCKKLGPPPPICDLLEGLWCLELSEDKHGVKRLAVVTLWVWSIASLDNPARTFDLNEGNPENSKSWCVWLCVWSFHDHPMHSRLLFGDCRPVLAPFLGLHFVLLSTAGHLLFLKLYAACWTHLVF